MRWLPFTANVAGLVAGLVACSRVTSRAINDADIDSPRTPLRDARVVDVGPPDAYVPRACDAPATFADFRTPSRILHVRPGALHGDGSAAAPFGTIAAAAAVAMPGTFILLEPGYHTPNQFIPNLHGLPDAPIWIGGVYGTRPVILGGSEGLHLTNARYVVVQNLAVRSQTSIGINVDDGVGTGLAHHILLSNVSADDISVGASLACIRATGVDDLYIYDSTVQHCNFGIDLVGVHAGAVARNAIRSVVLNSIQVRGGSTDVQVRQNAIVDGGNAGISLGGNTPTAWFRPPLSATVPNAEARRVRAFDNMIYGNTYAPFAIVGCVDCLVAHNLSFGAPSRVLRTWGPVEQDGYTFEPTGNVRVINNSFVWQAAISSHVEVGAGADLATFTWSHNLWLSVSSPAQSTPYYFPSVSMVPDTGALIGAYTGYSSGSIVPLPPFCGGPEAGAAAPLPEIDGTIEGYCRADGQLPTIGPQMYEPAGCGI